MSKSPEYIKGAVLGVIAGAVLSRIIPTPVDALYFYKGQRMRDKWKKGTITPSGYWTNTLTSYYILNPIYWALIGLLVAKFGSKPSRQLEIFITLVGASVAIALIIKFINKDISESKEEKKQLEELFEKYPELKETLNSPELKKFKLITV